MDNTKTDAKVPANKNFSVQLTADACREMRARFDAIPGANDRERLAFCMAAAEKELTLRLPQGEVLRVVDDAYATMRNVIAGTLANSESALANSLADKDKAIMAVTDKNEALQDELRDANKRENEANARNTQLAEQAERLRARCAELEETVSSLREQLEDTKKMVELTKLTDLIGRLTTAQTVPANNKQN